MDFSEEYYVFNTQLEDSLYKGCIKILATCVEILDATSCSYGPKLNLRAMKFHGGAYRLLDLLSVLSKCSKSVALLAHLKRFPN
jgi:hypothetical protein